MPLKKRVLNALVTPNKRAKVAPRSTASQPIIIETQSSLSRLSPRKALVEASRATNFESQLRESQAKDAIVAPAEGSEEATAALSKAADEATDKGFDAHLKDSFENINWSRLPQYIKPLASQRHRKSWIYRYSYRVALLKNPARLYFVCRYCHEHKYIDAGRGGIFETTRSPSAAARHLEERRSSHSYYAPRKAPVATSHNSVLRYVVRLYDYLKPRVVEELSQAISKIHLSFDGWTTKGGKRGFLGVVAHYVDHQGNLKDLPIALPQLTGAHSGEKMAEVVSKTLQEFNISPLTVSYFVLNNASNNNSAVLTIAQKIGFNAVYRRLRCGPHTINLIGQFMREWRRDGPLGVLLSIINYIKTPQQYALFANFQRLAHRELPIDAPAEERKILEPVKPVVTRQNSYYLCFERAVKLQSAVNAYANHYIKRVRDEDTYAQSRDALKPLKAATKRLEGRGKSGGFGAIAEIILVFEYLLGYYEQRVKAYEAVDYNAHNEAPKDHLAINLRAA
ncbi:hypothetical protein A1F94_013213 [Pyrenophora tritici-repentis]|nr:hypothetical protein A1F99_045800 [Pyrenophora tritici-repentis]KAG9375947.1 hypothetical protein A1F94_013213 [Pyrenophora tritici-repentis]